MTVPTPLRVLVVDDDADTRANLCDILELDGYTIETAGTAAAALGRRDLATFGVVLLDRRLPDGSAEHLLPRLKQLAPQAAVMIVTGYADLEGAIAALRAGAADYIVKPVNPDLLRSRLAGVAERKWAEELIHRLNQDLQRRVEELQTLLDVIPIGIAIAEDVECRRIRANPTLARLLGLAPDQNASPKAAGGGRPAYEVFRNGRKLPPHELPLQTAAAGGTPVRNVEFDVVRADGGVVNFFGNAAPLLDEHGRARGAVGAFVDVTERKRAQERLLQTERLAAIGQMMTGLAHESGNALARSQACLEMLTWEVQDNRDALDLIDRIKKAQDHLQHLYEEVRGYAAPVKLERETWDVSAVWRQAWENLALRRQGRDAALAEEWGGADLTCAVDHFRLEQVFRNMFENSLAACADPVRVTVCCSDTVLDGRPALRVAVRDNGPGLSAEQKQRIFEPFFTTKTKGTGLGMAIAKRIIDAHGGRLETGTPAGPGAEIIITLPREGP